MPRIAFVTCQKVPDITDDDAVLAAELRTRGCDVIAASWDDPIDWVAFDAVVLRSCWDYHHRADEFRGWIAGCERSGVKLWNPPGVVEWNLHKDYLRHAAEAGVSVPPTRWIAAGAGVPLDRILREERWTHAVVKPAISASATNTFRVSFDSWRDTESRFAELSSTQDMLVQRYLEEVARDGEWSLFFFGGAFSHAVLKRPASGDFRVQEELGGTALARTPSPELLRAASKATHLIPGDWLYVRVDGVSVEGKFLLMELECIEPRLYFLDDPAAAGRCAEALLARVASGGA